MRQLCQWPGFDQTNEEALRFVQKLVDFFTGEYLDVLENAQYNVVYHHDERWPKLSGVPEAELEEDEVEDADAEDEDSESEDEEDEEEVIKGDVSTYQELGAGHATTVEGAAAVAASAAAGAAAGVAIVEGAEAAAAAGAEAGKVARRAIAAAEPRVIRQGTVSRTPEGKTILTKRNGTVVDYVSKAVAVKELTEQTHTHGFDQISAVSQASINAWFKSLWSVSSTSKSTVDSLLARFQYEQYFSTKFQAPTVRLLSNNRAIIWLHLQDGWLKTLKNWTPWSESEAYKFDNWRLAFEVELKLADSDKLEGVSTAWNAKLEDSFVYKEHGKKDDRALKHIYLDFKCTPHLHCYIGCYANFLFQLLSSSTTSRASTVSSTASRSGPSRRFRPSSPTSANTTSPRSSPLAPTFSTPSPSSRLARRCPRRTRSPTSPSRSTPKSRTTATTGPL